MKILFLGDVMGRSGRHSLRDHLPQAISDYNIDFVIANGETLQVVLVLQKIYVMSCILTV